MRNVKTLAEREALAPSLKLAVHVPDDDSWDCYLEGDEIPPEWSPPVPEETAQG